MSRWVNSNVGELWLVSERRKVKAANIPDIDIMRFIKAKSMEAMTPGGWEAKTLPRWVFSWDFEDSPWSDTMPWKVVVAKLNKLERRGLISGCMCGCRMDIEITEKGQQFLDAIDLIAEDVRRVLDGQFIGQVRPAPEVGSDS